MSTLKEKTINRIIDVEGGYVDDPSDSGGETNFGITVAVAREFGYQGDMINLTKEQAFAIYSAMYWDVLGLSTIERMSTTVAEELADTGVNQGVSRAAKFLQRSLNVLNNKGEYYSDLIVDGDVGQGTLRALGEYLSLRGKEGEIVLHRMLNSLQGAFYVDLAERREKDEKYIFGWFSNRVT